RGPGSRTITIVKHNPIAGESSRVVDTAVKKGKQAVNNLRRKKARGFSVQKQGFDSPRGYWQHSSAQSSLRELLMASDSVWDAGLLTQTRPAGRPCPEGGQLRSGVAHEACRQLNVHIAIAKLKA